MPIILVHKDQVSIIPIYNSVRHSDGSFQCGLVPIDAGSIVCVGPCAGVSHVEVNSSGLHQRCIGWDRFDLSMPQLYLPKR